MNKRVVKKRLIPLFFFFFNDTPPTEIYTLSLHDALPICWPEPSATNDECLNRAPPSGLSSPANLVHCSRSPSCSVSSRSLTFCKKAAASFLHCATCKRC